MAAEALRLARLSADALGMPLCLVGGSVRDLLLGRDVRDLDLVTEGDAPRLAMSVAERAGRKPLLHSRFGTATIEMNGVRLDFSTARRETYPRPGALPHVVPSTIEEDLARRDFSINAMALGLAGHAEGSLLDPCHGREDLEKGLVRVLHNGSFVDDPTRMLRAVRYEQRLGFSIEPQTLGLLHEALARRSLNTVSPDRIRREIEALLVEERPVPALRRAGELSLLDAVYHGLEATLPNLASLSGPRHPLVFLGAMAYALQPQQAEGLIHRLNMPGEWARVVRDAAALRLKAEELESPDLRPSQAAALLEGADLYALEAAGAICPHPRARQRIACYLSEWRHATPCLRGGDLAQLGVPPGPETGRILKALGRARLDGQASCREEEIALVQGLMAQGFMEDAGGAK